MRDDAAGEIAEVDRAPSRPIGIVFIFRIGLKMKRFEPVGGIAGSAASVHWRRRQWIRFSRGRHETRSIDRM